MDKHEHEQRHEDFERELSEEEREERRRHDAWLRAVAMGWRLRARSRGEEHVANWPDLAEGWGKRMSFLNSANLIVNLANLEAPR